MSTDVNLQELIGKAVSRALPEVNVHLEPMPAVTVRTYGIDIDKFDEGLARLTEMVNETFEEDVDVYLTFAQSEDGAVIFVTVHQMPS